MGNAMNLVVNEMPVNEELENQQHDGIPANQLTNSKNFAIVAFENPGLCHIGENIFKKLDIQTKINGRLVRKSWNDVFEKQASKIDLINVPMLSKFLKEKPRWGKFLKELKAEITTLVLNSYLRDFFNKMLSYSSEEDEYKTPLIAFSRTGNSKIVDFILRKKIFVDEFDEWHKALKYAAIYGYVNVAKLLKPQRYRNILAIEYASRHGHLEVLKVLIDDDPKAMDLDYYTIWTGAFSGKIEVLEYFERLNNDWFEKALLKRVGLDQTIIHYLAEDGHLEIIKYLCQKALFKNPIQNDSLGSTPIYYAAGKGHLEIVKFLAPYTSNPNATGKDGDTPIHYAAEEGHLEVVKFLASNTSNPNAARCDGRTPIHSAAKKDHLEVVKFLALNATNPNVADQYGETPIHVAATEGHLEVVKFMALHTSNPNAAKQNGRTPIHKAAEFGHFEVVKFLASYTSNPNSPDSMGMTPSKIARQNGFMDIVAYLLKLENKEDTKYEN